MNENMGFSQRWVAFRPSKAIWFWSCVACVVATMVVGFVWGGWTTGGTAAKMASDAAELAATMCVTRFMEAPNAATHLATLKKTDSWERGDMIQKGGWATIAGVKEVPSGTDDLCAQKLASMEAPKPVAETKDVTPVKAGG
jgi:hypothetical protein